ncbi:hypothetical protein D3C80_878540 [compost metagenome]
MPARREIALTSSAMFGGSNQRPCHITGIDNGEGARDQPGQLAVHDIVDQLSGGGRANVGRTPHPTGQDHAGMHLGMCFQERQDDTVGEDLAAVIVIRVGVGPQTCLIDGHTRCAVEHSNGRRMDEPSYTGAVGLVKQAPRTRHIDLFKFFPVAAALVVIAKERRGVKHRIAALQRCCESVDIGHVTNDQLHPRQIVELLFTFGS